MKRNVLMALVCLLLSVGLIGCKENEETHEHVYGEWVVVSEATCTKKGEREKSCSCGEKVKEEIAMLAHTEEVIKGKEATCTEEGLTEGKKCSVCGTILVAQEAIKAKGHSYSEEYKYDEEYHWHEATCNDTEEVSGKEKHTYENGVCKCGQVEKKTTVTLDEWKKLFEAENIKMYFYDSNAQQTVIYDGNKIYWKGHTISTGEDVEFYFEYVTDSEGNRTWYCYSQNAEGKWVKSLDAINNGETYYNMKKTFFGFGEYFSSFKYDQENDLYKADSLKINYNLVNNSIECDLKDICVKVADGKIAQLVFSCLMDYYPTPEYHYVDTAYYTIDEVGTATVTLPETAN